MKLAAKLIILSLSFSFTLAFVAAAASGDGMGMRPANPKPDNPRTQSIFIFDSTGGGIKNDQLLIDNRTDKLEVVELYAVDGSTSGDGSFACKQRTDQAVKVGVWIKLSAEEVSVPARSHRVVDFSVTIPDILKAGEYNGCIVMLSKQNAGGSGDAVVIQTRRAVRVAVVVPGDIYREVRVDDFSAKTVNGKQGYSFALKSNGNVSADIKANLRLKDVFGREVYKNSGQYVVLADQRLLANISMDYHPFFGGFYMADLSIDYDKRAGVFGTNDQAQLAQDNSGAIAVFIWPSVWFWLLLGLLILLLFGPKVWRLVGSRPRIRARN